MLTPVFGIQRSSYKYSANNNAASCSRVCFINLSRRVFEDSIDDLPSATAPIDEFNCCDVCKRKDEKFKYAQMYCVVCAKKLCDSHLKVRNSQCNVTVGA